MGKLKILELLKLYKEKLLATNVVNQNANLDEHSFGGRKGQSSDVIAKAIALDEEEGFMCAKSIQLHESNHIYIHDLDAYALGMHNCLSIPLDDLLKNGFVTRQCTVRPARSVNTAFQLCAVIMQLQSLQQFGGVSYTHLDWSLVPYVKISFAKHYKDGLKYICGVHKPEEHYDETRSITDGWYATHPAAARYALEMTEREVYQAVEGFYHNLNTLQSRSGNQLPFSSINYGTCTLPEGRMIIKALLDVLYKGVGPKGETSIFPCGIFQYWEDVNGHPGTPNYDLFELAVKCTARRLYPNYANVDWSGNAGFDPNDPRTYFSTMGALAGHEHLTVRVNDGEPIDITIKALFDWFNSGIVPQVRKTQLFYNQPSVYIPGNKHIQDHSNDGAFKEQAGVYKITYLPQDVTYFGSSANVAQRVRDHKSTIRTTGGLDAGPSFADREISHYQFEVVEYTDNFKDVEERYILSEPNINFKGVSKRYYKVSASRKATLERPNIKMKPEVPQDFISLEDLNIKVFDKDGKWTKVKHIFRNNPYNTPLLMYITYKEHDKEYVLSCTEDHPLWVGDTFVKASDLTLSHRLYRADGLELPIVDIRWRSEADERCYTYDIGTETGTFIGSDIIMHNCRTANGWDVNGFGQLKDGRGNICPVTIILPTYAKEVLDSIPPVEGVPCTTRQAYLAERFLDAIDAAIDDAKDMLIERFEYICSQSPSSAKFMWVNNTMAGYIPEEGIRSALKHGTLAIGQLGLAEALFILFGYDHTDPRGMEFAKRLEGLFQTKVAAFKKKYSLNFGVYYTPAESLCATALRKFREEYGVIAGVSDKDYFTNSMHVPVWYKCNPFEKIDIESQLTGYSSAGCITYVELPAEAEKNPEAVLEMVQYGMHKDIPYLGINVPNDVCKMCGCVCNGYDVCPECGSAEIKHLRRVTGYITGDYQESFNSGKQSEVADRVDHTKHEVL